MAIPATAILAGGAVGADLLSGLLGGGNSKELKATYQRILAMLQDDSDIIDIDNLDQMQAPGIDAEATRLSKRLGLSSPLAQAGISKMNQGHRQDLFTQNSLLKNQRKMSLTQLLAALSGQFE